MWIKNYFSMDNTVNENTVIGTFLIICSAIAGLIQKDPVIMGEFLTGGLLCFGINLKKGQIK